MAVLTPAPRAALGAAVPLSPSALPGLRHWLGKEMLGLCRGISCGLPGAAARVGAGWGGIAPAELTLQVICSGRVVPVPPVPLGYQL